MSHGHKGKVSGKNTQNLRIKVRAAGVASDWSVRTSDGVVVKYQFTCKEIQFLIDRLANFQAGRAREVQASATRRDNTSMHQHCFWVAPGELSGRDSVGQGERGGSHVQYVQYVQYAQDSTERSQCRSKVRTVQYVGG